MVMRHKAALISLYPGAALIVVPNDIEHVVTSGTPYTITSSRITASLKIPHFSF